MLSRCRLIGPAVACVVASSGFAAAQTTTPSVPAAPVAPAAPASYPFTLGGAASYAFDTDLGDDGSFSVFRSSSTITVDHSLSESSGLRVVLDGEYSHYFFRDLAAVPGSDGSDSLDAYAFDLRPSYSKYFSETFSVFGGLILAASGMADADLGDSLSYGAFGGVNYRVAPGVWVGGGLSFVTQLEDSALVVPLLTLNWQINPDTKLTSEGLGLRLSYKLDDAWTLYARGKYEFRQFRLASDEVISDGVLSDSSVPLAVGVTYDLGEQLTFSAEAGVVAYRRIEFQDDDGDDVGADEADPTAFLGIQLRYSF